MKTKNYTVTEYAYMNDESGKPAKVVVATKDFVSTSKQAVANEYFGVERAVLSMSLRGYWTEGRAGRRLAAIEIITNNAK